MKLNIMMTETVTILNFKDKSAGIKDTFTFDAQHLNYQKATKVAKDLFDRLQQGQKITHKHYEEIKSISSITSTLETWSNGLVEITPTSVKFKGVVLNSQLASFVIGVLVKEQNDKKLSAWSKYIELINTPNSSYKVVNRLFSFLEKEDLRIDDEGNVLAWKVVRPNFRDKHSGKFDNSPGQILEMPRQEVNDDDNSYCSYGFHICSWGYLKSFASRGDKVVQVKVNPADIVSIPLDYDGEKVRTCKYEVLHEVGEWDISVSATQLPKMLGHTATEG